MTQNWKVPDTDPSGYPFDLKLCGHVNNNKQDPDQFLLFLEFSMNYSEFSKFVPENQKLGQ